jgi:hypothetical protein
MTSQYWFAPSRSGRGAVFTGEARSDSAPWSALFINTLFYVVADFADCASSAGIPSLESIFECRRPAKHEHQHFALMYIDLDKFKPAIPFVHAVGDLLLNEAAPMPSGGQQPFAGKQCNFIKNKQRVT